MKKAYAIVVGIGLLVACHSKPEGYTVNATVTGNIDPGTQVYLNTTNDRNEWVAVDTTTVENGTFRFTGVQDEPKMHYIVVEATRGNIPLVLENKAIAVTFQKDSLNYAEVTGTLQNQWLMDFFEESRKSSVRIQSMQKDMRRAARKKDTATASALREEYREMQEETKDFNATFVKQHPNALISVLLLKSLLTSKSLPHAEIEAMYNALAPALKTSAPGVAVKQQLDHTKSTAIGAIAPEFSAPTPEGNTLALSDVKGKLTLIDFWAAWCKPCRAENPNVVKLYNAYHDKGFTIIGVSLDSRAEDWKKAITADGLTWHHISNLKRFRDPIAQRYNVDAIPATFLLDEDGVIVAKNLRGRALEQKVAEMLP